MNFEMIFNRQLWFGENKIEKLVEIVHEFRVKRIFLVTFSSENEAFLRLASILNQANIQYNIFTVRHEPTTETIDNARDLFLQYGCDCTVAFGGGSVIDTAKAVGMLAFNGGNAEDYQMFGRQVTTTPPLFIAIPTTSGTGAEATKTSVVTNTNNGLKKSLYHTSMIADVVILDPTLITKLSKKRTSSTGMDALSHAIESYVSLNANPITEIYGLHSMQLVINNLEQSWNKPEDLIARGNMLLGSYYGGIAISAGIGIAHIMAQPIGAEFNIPHGDACSIFLPHAMRLNLPYATKKYVDISKSLNVYDETLSDEENGNKAIQRVEKLQNDIEAPKSLRPYLPEKINMEKLIDVVMRTTGHITCNPKPLTEKLIRNMFDRAMD